MSVRLRNYRFEVDQMSEMSPGEAKAVILTVTRGLWNTNHSRLRNDASSVRQDLAEAESLDSDLRQRVESVVERFNALAPEGLNRPLLDDNTMPMNGEPRPTALIPQGSEPKPGPTEHRQENAENNLHALNGSVGIVKDPNGSWVPTPDGQFARNAQVQSRLGYTRAEDGTVALTWADNVDHQLAQTHSIASEALSLARLNKETGRAGQSVNWRVAVFVAVILSSIFYVLTGIAWGWTAMILPALGALLALTVVSALLLPRLSPSNESGSDSDNQPRG